MYKTLADRIKAKEMELRDLEKVRWVRDYYEREDIKPPPPLPPPPSLKDQIRYRLRWNNAPFANWHVVENDEKVFVFIVHNGQATVLEDSATMFPSDQLVTSIRLLAG